MRPASYDVAEMVSWVIVSSSPVPPKTNLLAGEQPPGAACCGSGCSRPAAPAHADRRAEPSTGPRSPTGEAPCVRPCGSRFPRASRPSTRGAPRRSRSSRRTGAASAEKAVARTEAKREVRHDDDADADALGERALESGEALARPPRGAHEHIAALRDRVLHDALRDRGNGHVEHDVGPRERAQVARRIERGDQLEFVRGLDETGRELAHAPGRSGDGNAGGHGPNLPSRSMAR